jgi:hypothetical protein
MMPSSFPVRIARALATALAAAALGAIAPHAHVNYKFQ